MHFFRCRTDWSGLLQATLVAAALLLCTGGVLVHAQGKWRGGPVMSALWLSQEVGLDSLAMPGIAVTGDGLVYLAFSLRGGQWRYYTKDHPAYPGIFSGFSPIVWGQGIGYSSGPTNLLAVDSGSTLHYISGVSTSEMCIQYANNQLVDTVLTSFSYLESVGPQACGERLGGASIAADAVGTLHMVCIVDDVLFYFSRTSGIWSPGLRISDSSIVAGAPSIAVTPSGQVHIVYLAHSAVPASDVAINYVSGADGVFGEPVTLAVRNGEESDGVASLTVDSDGFCHVAFVDRSSGKVPSIRYTNNVGGVWGRAESALENSRYAFDDVSLVADRYGALHIVACYNVNDADSLSNGELLYIRNVGRGWSPPMNITASDLDERAVNQGNGFVAVHDSVISVVYMVHNHAGEYALALSQLNIDFDPLLDISPDTIDLGSHYAESGMWTVDTTLDVRNGGGALYRALSLNEVKVVDAVPSDLTLAQARMPRGVRGGDSAPLPLSVSGGNTGPFSMRVAFNSNGGSDTIVLAGTILKPVAAVHVLQLSSDTIDVGSLALLHGTITPPLTEGDDVKTLSLRLAFPARSLFPHRVLPADPNAPVTISSSYDGTGTLRLSVSGKDGRVLEGGTLFTVELEGLLTGEFVNEVGLGMDSVPDGFDPQLVPGWVYLYGCDVGKNLQFGKAGFAGRITPNPVKDVLGFEYVAPAAVPVSVYLVDLLGTEKLAAGLPSGTGEPQQAGINIGTLAPGLYFVRLRVGERVVTDMMIKE